MALEAYVALHLINLPKLVCTHVQFPGVTGMHVIENLERSTKCCLSLLQVVLRVPPRPVAGLSMTHFGQGHVALLFVTRAGGVARALRPVHRQ